MLLSLLADFTRGGYYVLFGLSGSYLALLVGSLLFFCFTLLSLVFGPISKRPKFIIWSILIGSSLLDLPALVLLPDTALSIPDFVARYIAILVAYGCYEIKPFIAKSLLGLLWVGMIFWLIFSGLELWSNKIQFGSWTGEMTLKEYTPMHFQAPQGDTITVADYSGRYLVLDFWTTSCGVCWKKFPQVEALYQKIKSNAKIAFYGVHCRNEKERETISTGIEKLKEKGYTFPSLSVALNDPTVQNIGVIAFPTVLIFSPQGDVIFRGSIENAAQYLEQQM